jgi:hypothetical protein
MHPITYNGVATYRGIDAGWVPVGGPRNKQDTERLLQLVNRIRPDYLNKLKILSMDHH